MNAERPSNQNPYPAEYFAASKEWSRLPRDGQAAAVAPAAGVVIFSKHSEILGTDLDENRQGNDYQMAEEAAQPLNDYGLRQGRSPETQEELREVVESGAYADEAIGTILSNRQASGVTAHPDGSHTIKIDGVEDTDGLPVNQEQVTVNGSGQPIENPGELH